jgi:hypothetical protein
MMTKSELALALLATLSIAAGTSVVTGQAIAKSTNSGTMFIAENKTTASKGKDSACGKGSCGKDAKGAAAAKSKHKKTTAAKKPTAAKSTPAPAAKEPAAK